MLSNDDSSTAIQSGTDDLIRGSVRLRASCTGSFNPRGVEWSEQPNYTLRYHVKVVWELKCYYNSWHLIFMLAKLLLLDLFVFLSKGFVKLLRTFKGVLSVISYFQFFLEI